MKLGELVGDEEYFCKVFNFFFQTDAPCKN